MSPASPSAPSRHAWSSRRRWALSALALTAWMLLGCEPEDDDVLPLDGGGEGGAGGQGGQGGEGGMGGAGGGGPVDECTRNSECPAQRPACDLAATPTRCVECLDSSFCDADAPVCGPGEICMHQSTRACREDFDCAIEVPICLLDSATGVCVACRTDRDCPGARPRCATTGRCVASGASLACADNDACGFGRDCTGGECRF